MSNEHSWQTAILNFCVCLNSPYNNSACLNSQYNTTLRVRRTVPIRIILSGHQMANPLPPNPLPAIALQNFPDRANAFTAIAHEMTAMPNPPVINQGQILHDIQRILRRGFRRARQVRQAQRRDSARLYVDASCIQLFKDEVANTGGSREHNNSARLMNSSITHPDALLEPLYDINNQPIANFPRTSGHLGRLRGVYPTSRQAKHFGPNKL